MLRVLALLLALIPFPALAQQPVFEITPTATGLEFVLSGHTVEMPVPVWTVATAEPVEQAQAFYNRIGDGVESLVLLPPEETLVTWTRLMGVLAVDRPGYDPNAHYASLIQPMQDTCASGALVMSWLSKDESGSHDGLLLACGRYRPTAGATQKCGGGIILAVVVTSTRGAAKIYDEWCTGSFDVDKGENWPVNQAELLATATKLQQGSRYVPLQ